MSLTFMGSNRSAENQPTTVAQVLPPVQYAKLANESSMEQLETQVREMFVPKTLEQRIGGIPLAPPSKPDASVSTRTAITDQDGFVNMFTGGGLEEVAKAGGVHQEDLQETKKELTTVIEELDFSRNSKPSLNASSIKSESNLCGTKEKKRVTFTDNDDHEITRTDVKYFVHSMQVNNFDSSAVLYVITNPENQESVKEQVIDTLEKTTKIYNIENVYTPGNLIDKFQQDSIPDIISLDLREELRTTENLTTLRYEYVAALKYVTNTLNDSVYQYHMQQNHPNIKSHDWKGVLVVFMSHTAYQLYLSTPDRTLPYGYYINASNNSVFDVLPKAFRTVPLLENGFTIDFDRVKRAKFIYNTMLKNSNSVLWKLTSKSDNDNNVEFYKNMAERGIIIDPRFHSENEYTSDTITRLRINIFE